MSSEMTETTNEYIPAPRLSITDDERNLIDSVIDDTVRGIRRSVISIGRVVEINNHPRECAVIDKLIEVGIDKLRPALKVDFYEKFFDRLCERCDSEQDDATGSMGLLWMRAFDSFRLVISITKKYRGRPHCPPFHENEAREMLKRRGLWKR